MRPDASKADDAIACRTSVHRAAEALILDLASLESVRTAANAFVQTGRTLSVCVLNAGIMALPWRQTVDGFEQQWQVNVLGHFLLCRLLLPTMAEANGRVVHLSSGAHRRHPGPIDYERLAQSIDRMGHDCGLPMDAVNSRISYFRMSWQAPSGDGRKDHEQCAAPGPVGHHPMRDDPGVVPAADGARTSIYRSLSPDVAGKTGGYYIRSAPVCFDGARTEISLSAEAGKGFWCRLRYQLSEAL